MSKDNIFLFLKRLFLTICMVAALACNGMIFANTAVVPPDDKPGGGNGGCGCGSGGGRPKKDGSADRVEKDRSEGNRETKEPRDRGSGERNAPRDRERGGGRDRID